VQAGTEGRGAGGGFGNKYPHLIHAQRHGRAGGPGAALEAGGAGRGGGR
jgi:hypothetical protein